MKIRIMGRRAQDLEMTIIARAYHSVALIGVGNTQDGTSCHARRRSVVIVTMIFGLTVVVVVGQGGFEKLGFV